MKDKEKFTRREFMGTVTATATAASILPLSCDFTKEAIAAPKGKNSGSIFNGVKVGAITYSFKDVPADVDALIKACNEAGLSYIQLQASNYGVEEYLGAPKDPSPSAMNSAATVASTMTVYTQPGAQRASGNKANVSMFGEEQAEQPQGGRQMGGAPAGQGQAGGGQMGGPGGQQQSPEQIAYNEALKSWRLSVPMSKYEELGKKFREAGINVHILELGIRDASDEETEYMFKASKAIGAKATSGGDLLGDSYKSLVPFAEKHGIYILFHNHYEYADPNVDVDSVLNFSPMCALNFDVGHYYGSTGLDPRDFMEKYHKRIFSIHIKDKTGPNNKYWINTNQPWGQGETPIRETLQLIRDKKWSIYCDIELEYDIAPWNNSVKEVKNCVYYCKGALC